MQKRLWFYIFLLCPLLSFGQINTKRVMTIGRNALYFEDYVLSIQYFNQVINAKPYMHEPYFYRGLAKLNLEDYSGAEQDCTESIERNPFMVASYQVRGLARIHLGNFDGAISDYRQALSYSPEDVGTWHNLVLCQMRKENYELALEDLEKLLRVSPRYVPAYLMRSEIYLKQHDTLRAEDDIQYALQLDKFDENTLATRAMLRFQQEKYVESEADLDQVIYLNPQNAGYHVNRALVRFHQNNLRGAMDDYDRAIEISPHHLIALYNRGLLRAQVGDDNRAIEDFDKVIDMEPNNMMALFNRGLLRDQTGDYRGAIEDYSEVIDEYPNFLYGYQKRAEARRKIGDRKGADADAYKLLKAEIDRRNGVETNIDDEEHAEKTRKKSNRNVNNYQKMVVADNDESTSKYKNEYRGRVQNRHVKVELQPMFVLTYYYKVDDLNRNVAFHKSIESINIKGGLPKQLYITNMETSLNQEQIDEHFNSVNDISAAIVRRPNDAELRFARSLDFYLIQDLNSAVEDLGQTVICDDRFMPAYFNRAVIRCKLVEYERASMEISTDESLETGLNTAHKGVASEYELAKADFDKVIRLSPDFEYAYYNRGNFFYLQEDYHAAIVDYNQAIQIRDDFAEAYFNRGLTHIFLGNTKEGLADLSKAGELGIYTAYNLIKRYSEVKE